MPPGRALPIAPRSGRLTPMTSRRFATAVLSLAALAVTASACGDDPAADGVGAGSTPESTLPSSEGAPTGEGSITVDGVDYAFHADVCSLTPVNHVARDYELYVHGEGEIDGETFVVEVARSISDSGNSIEAVNLDFGDGELSGGTNTVVSAADARFDVTSSLLIGDMDLVGTGDTPVGTAEVNVTCS